MINLKHKRIYHPIIILLSWLVLTILSFVFGPWNYILKNPFVFYAYLFLIHSALLLGYIFGQNADGCGTRIRVNYYKLVESAIIISFVYLIVKLIFTRGGDVSNFIETFKNALKTYSSNYVTRTSLFSYLDIFFTPIFVIAITNAICSHNKIRPFFRCCVYLMIIVTLASSVGSATRAGIMQIILLSFSALLLSIYKMNFILKLYHKILMPFIIIISITAFFSYSSAISSTRGGISLLNPMTNESAKENYFLFQITPQKLNSTITNTSFYISHSYYQLNKALNMPTLGIAFGLSNSFFVMDNIEQFTGWSWPKKISYGLRLDDQIGRGYGLFWSTFYTWIASDVTFPGTIIIVFLIGYLFSLALRDSLSSLNPLAVTSFCTLFYFIFHFAFNNPLQDGVGIMTYFMIPILWLITRDRNSSM
jgi:hypothetical protein